MRLFAREGARVVFCGRGTDAGTAIADSLDSNVRFVTADVTGEEDIARTVADARSNFGRADILFNNAGGSTPGSMESLTPEQFHYGMDLLLGSVLFGTRHVVPIMREQKWGRIINNSSVNGIRVSGGDWLYGAAKAAVTHKRHAGRPCRNRRRLRPGRALSGQRRGWLYQCSRPCSGWGHGYPSYLLKGDDVS